MCPAGSAVAAMGSTAVSECICGAGFVGPDGGACTACGVVRESYVPPATFYSSLRGQEFNHPQLDNALYQSGWAASTNDQNQVRPRPVHNLMRREHRADRLWCVPAVLL